MCKNLIVILLATVAVSLFVSCSLEKPEFSCDPEVEAWAQENHGIYTKA